MTSEQHPFLVEEVTDPRHLAEAQERGKQCARNVAWLREHATEIFSRNRGKHVCIASAELFAADTVQEARASAKAAHSEDTGRYLRYIPKHRPASPLLHRRALTAQ